MTEAYAKAAIGMFLATFGAAASAAGRDRSAGVLLVVAALIVLSALHDARDAGDGQGRAQVHEAWRRQIAERYEQDVAAVHERAEREQAQIDERLALLDEARRLVDELRRRAEA